MNKIGLYLALGLLAIAGPAYSEKPPECLKDGVKYGETKGAFRDKWWNYLERGQSYLEGGCYEAALNDLDRAIELRRQMVKNEHDKTRARTYGLHFVDYFPHREKGIALYRLGRMDEARTELEQSLKAVESQRARQYLDMAEMAKKSPGSSCGGQKAPGQENK